MKLIEDWINHRPAHIGVVESPKVEKITGCMCDLCRTEREDAREGTRYNER